MYMSDRLCVFFYANLQYNFISISPAFQTMGVDDLNDIVIRCKVTSAGNTIFGPSYSVFTLAECAMIEGFSNHADNGQRKTNNQQKNRYSSFHVKLLSHQSLKTRKHDTQERIVLSRSLIRCWGCRGSILRLQ